MPKLRVGGFSVSIDGYGAGPNQRMDHPLGENGMELHEWFFETLTFRRMHGQEGGRDGLDEAFAARAMSGVGAWILGRNMFGPVRGPWPDESWRGWWASRGTIVRGSRIVPGASTALAPMRTPSPRSAPEAHGGRGSMGLTGRSQERVFG
jgi:dihydrofolate reductase